MVAAKNPIAVTGSKVMINYARDHANKNALDYMALWQTGMFAPRPHEGGLHGPAGEAHARNPDLAPVRKKL